MEIQSLSLTERMSGYFPLLLFFIVLCGGLVLFYRFKECKCRERLNIIACAYFLVILLNSLLYRSQWLSPHSTVEMADLYLLLMFPQMPLVFLLLYQNVEYAWVGMVTGLNVVLSLLFWVNCNVSLLVVLSVLSSFVILVIMLFMMRKEYRGEVDVMFYLSNSYFLLMFTGYLSLLIWIMIGLIVNNPLLKTAFAILVVLFIYILIVLWSLKWGKSLAALNVHCRTKKYNQDVRYLAENSSEYGGNDIHERLFLLLEEDKPYLSPDLTIADLAKMVYTNQSYLSKFLNNTMKMNFNVFINNYRVNEAMLLFEKNNELSLSEMCTMSGFRNISSFNNAFKLRTGSTPGEWCRKVKKRGDYEKFKGVI